MTTTTIKKADLSRTYKAWNKGKLSKIEAERQVFGNDAGRGKKIARLWEDRLGVDTRYLVPQG